jgi:hypothetical protein
MCVRLTNPSNVSTTKPETLKQQDKTQRLQHIPQAAAAAAKKEGKNEKKNESLRAESATARSGITAPSALTTTKDKTST